MLDHLKCSCQTCQHSINKQIPDNTGQSEQVGFAKQYLSTLKNCKALNSRIGLENRLFDFKNYASALLTDDCSADSKEETKTQYSLNITPDKADTKFSSKDKELIPNEKNFYFNKGATA